NFHLVLLDLKLQTNELPMNSNEGWLLLDHLVEAFPKTKILIISGQASPHDVAQLLTRYPIIGFVEKQHFTREKITEAVAQATKAPALRIQTLGQFKLWRDGEAITNWERPQAEMIAKLLLTRRASGDRAISSEELITRFWPDADETSGRKKLLPLISNARRTIEPDIEPRDSNFILRTTNGYFFDLTGHITWDALAFREALQRGNHCLRQEDWEGAIMAYEKGAKLYQGDFLAEDRYADWTLSLRHELANDYRDLQISLADCHAALGDYDKAIAACEIALRKDPILESGYRRLMRFHYCNQEKGLALRVYRDCVKLFEELVEGTPTPATRHLHDDIINDRSIDCLAER
ncbi:MAG: BTAD domain-containing putative transcriptional regulator, partial [Chloroflexota bacterium]